MKFILIFWLLSGPSNFAPTGTALFDDEDACRVALKEIAAQWQGEARSLPGVCVPQSTEAPAPAPKAPSAPVVAVPAKRAP